MTTSGASTCAQVGGASCARWTLAARWRSAEAAALDHSSPGCLGTRSGTRRSPRRLSQPGCGRSAPGLSGMGSRSLAALARCHLEDPLRKPTLQSRAPRRSRPAGLRSRRPRAGAARPLRSHPRAGPRPGPLHLSAPGSRFPCQNFLPRRGPSPTSFLPPPLRASPPASHSLRLPPLRSRAGDPRPALRAALAVPTPGPRRDRTPSR